MKIETTNLNSYAQNFFQQNKAVNVEYQKLNSPPYQVELSENAISKKSNLLTKIDDQANISLVQQFGADFEVHNAEKLAENKENFRQEMIQSINKSIGEVLKPYETFEEAYENLYARETTGFWNTFDEENMKVNTSPKISGVQGAFGVLANHLNNYLDQFGANDGYFDNLIQNLEKIDTNQTDSLIRQIKNMLSTVREGNFIDIHSEKFENDVNNAIYEAYTNFDSIEQKNTKNKENKPKMEQKGLSYLEIVRLKTKEDEQFLNILLGEENKNENKIADEIITQRYTKIIGEMISQFKNSTEDNDFKENLINLYSNIESDNFYEKLETGQEESIYETKLDEKKILNRKIISEKWEEISEQTDFN